ncbi:hypothetical protein [Sphingomonas crusticola]|uniref:hypothetical protein n=1 Tax=Sphingomonas crusticola TaxID=1697973 RepID=UPI000E236ED2|nr:hypothetical protein [Sphingomonas crusticola]
MLSMIMFAAAAIAANSPVPEPAAASAPMCQNDRVEMAAARPSARARKLNELPNANLVLGVLRSEGGWQKPVIVRYDIGGAPKGR